MQFLFTPTETDYLQFARFRTRLTKSGFMLYVLCAGMLALSLYETIETKKYVYVVTTGCLVLALAAAQLYSLYKAPKRQLRRKAGMDPLYIGETRMQLTENAVTLHLGAPNGGAVVEAVYPYSAISAVFETLDSFYFFIAGTEIQMLPKRAIPEEQKDSVTELLKKLANYQFVK